MITTAKKPIGLALVAALALPAAGSLSAQELNPASASANAQVREERIDVVGSLPSDLSGLAEGPELDGFISQRRGRELTVTTENGEYKIIEGLEIDAFSQERINTTLAELQGEQEGVKHLL